MTDANVVHLNKVAPQHPPISPVGRLPVALTQVRDKAAQQLKQALQGLFDSADDSLFEMADRARNDVEQFCTYPGRSSFLLPTSVPDSLFLRPAALALAVFTLVASFYFHAYWALLPEHQLIFFKSIAIVGGLLAFTAFGPGAFSIDARRAAR